MRSDHARLLLPLLTICQGTQASLQDLAKRSGSERAPLHIRDALAQQAVDLIHEHGQNVDISLEGYDHDLVARNFEESTFEPRSFDADIGLEEQKFGRMELHPVTGGQDSAEEHWLQRREAFSRQEEVVRQRLGDGIDYSLSGYDHTLVDRSLGDDSGVDLSLAGYDTNLLNRDLDAFGGEDDEEEVDYSLEGYDHALVARSLKRSAAEHGAGSNAVPSLHTVIKGPPVQAKRQVVDARSTEVSGARSWASIRRWIGG